MASRSSRCRSSAAVKEKRKGPLSRAAGIAEGMAATVRRMQREREPRVLVYDPAGYARLIQPEARGHDADHGAGRGDAWPRLGARVTLVDPELAARVLERALARGGDMAELYAEARRGFAISLDDGRVERPQGGRERGACVRVVQGDSTYYGHVDGLAEEDLLRVAGSVSEAVRGDATHPAELRGGASPGHRHEIATPPGGRGGAPQGGAAARVRRARPRCRAGGRAGAHRLRRDPAPGRGLRLRRARGQRRPHAHPAERAGGGSPERPGRDRHGHARRPRGLGAARGATRRRWPRRRRGGR